MENLTCATERCEEVFDFIWSHGNKQKENNEPTNELVLFENKTACHSPLLTWDHFEHLIDKCVFRADDLSFYVFAFMLHCDAHYPYCIPKCNFVECLYTLSRQHNVHEFGEEYVVAFELLRQGVLDLNKRIWSSDYNTVSEVDKNHDCTLRAFYEFLYEWCLRYNKTADRITVAIELWSMFFHDEAIGISEDKKDANCFHGYVTFPRLPLWLEFIRQESAEQNEEEQNENVILIPSRDVWNQLLLFSRLTELDSYDCNDAWPLVIDKFVTWLKSRC